MRGAQPGTHEAPGVPDRADHLFFSGKSAVISGQEMPHVQEVIMILAASKQPSCSPTQVEASLGQLEGSCTPSPPGEGITLPAGPSQGQGSPGAWHTPDSWGSTAPPGRGQSSEVCALRPLPGPTRVYKPSSSPPSEWMSLVGERARQVWPGLANDLQSTYQLANAILGSGPKVGPAKLGHTFLRREGIPTVRDHADAGKEH